MNCTCGGLLLVTDFEIYCSHCGLVVGEILMLPIDHDGAGTPEREFVTQFYYNFKQTAYLKRRELRRVLSSNRRRVFPKK